MKISVTGYIYSKDSELFADCADRYAINQDNHKFAISDGVTKSFFPNFWAEILVTEFVESSDEKFDEPKWIQIAQEKWHNKVSEVIKKPGVKWYTRNAYNRGDAGLATFVGLQLIPEEKKWFATVLGDSFLFFIPDSLTLFDHDDKVILSSKPEPRHFDNFPDYYKSMGSEHKGIRFQDGGIIKNGIFYLMTDALAEWFLNEKENAIGKIKVWSSQSDFEKFVDEERLSEKLGNDDSAILIIEVSDVSNSDGVSYGNINVSFIGELILNEQKALRTNESISCSLDKTSGTEYEDKTNDVVKEIQEDIPSDKAEAFSTEKSLTGSDKSITEQLDGKSEEITSDEEDNLSNNESDVPNENSSVENVPTEPRFKSSAGKRESHICGLFNNIVGSYKDRFSVVNSFFQKNSSKQNETKVGTEKGVEKESIIQDVNSNISVNLPSDKKDN